MRENTDVQVLEKILFHCQLITGWIENHNKDFNDFVVGSEFFDAVSMREMQIGEVSKKLSTEFRNETKDTIPWQQIRGMRNLYAHHYEDMKIKDIWNTALTDIPKLQAFCEEYLKENNN